MKLKIAKGFFHSFLKLKSNEADQQEVNLSNPIHFSRLSPKIKFLSNQLLRLDSGVSLLRYHFSLAAKKIAIPFVAKNQKGEAIFAWHFKKLESISFLKLFAQFELIKKESKLISRQIVELQGFEKQPPKFWVITQEIDVELEPLLPYLRGLNFEVFKLQITRKGNNALVSIQKLIQVSIDLFSNKEIKVRSKPKTKKNTERPKINEQVLNLYPSFREVSQVKSVSKVKAVKKDIVLDRKNARVEMTKNVVKVENDLLNDEEDITEPFISLESLRESGMAFDKNSFLSR